MLGPDATFRDGQREAIEAVAEDGERALVVQRTGWGKSLVYWIATRVRRDEGHGPTLIISPLLALMRNQIAMADRLGLRAATINSGNQAEWDDVEAGLARRRDRRPAHLAGAPRQRALHEGRPAEHPGLDRPVRRRRGALHLRLGPRLPARLPADRPDPAAARPARPGPRDDGDRQRPGRRGHRRAARRGRPGHPRPAGARLAQARCDHARRPGRAPRVARRAVLPDLPGSGIVYCLTVADTQRVATFLRLAGHRRPGLQRRPLDRASARRSRTP